MNDKEEVFQERYPGKTFPAWIRLHGEEVELIQKKLFDRFEVYERDNTQQALKELVEKSKPLLMGINEADFKLTSILTDEKIQFQELD